MGSMIVVIYGILCHKTLKLTWSLHIQLVRNSHTWPSQSKGLSVSNMYSSLRVEWIKILACWLSLANYTPDMLLKLVSIQAQKRFVPRKDWLWALDDLEGRRITAVHIIWNDCSCRPNGLKDRMSSSLDSQRSCKFRPHLQQVRYSYSWTGYMLTVVSHCHEQR